MPPPGEARPNGFVGNSRAVRLLFERVERFAPNEAPVLITGESGTGKELIARALHHQSPRATRPFITVSCAAFPETLLEAELFGHERGAFTGAVHRREGRFQAADGGTLFLDEVAEVPLTAQVKLLRVLQEGVFEPLGSNRSVHVRVRVVSATHRDLKAFVEQGRFRDDLFYRLNVLELSIPPLRARREDVPLLVSHFLAHFSGDGKAQITDEARAALESYHYPGNVRELEHVIQQAVVLADGGPVDLVHLPAEISGHARRADAASLRHAARAALGGAVPVRGRLPAACPAGGRRGEAAGGGGPGDLAQEPLAETPAPRDRVVQERETAERQRVVRRHGARRPGVASR